MLVMTSSPSAAAGTNGKKTSCGPSKVNTPSNPASRNSRERAAASCSGTSNNVSTGSTR